MFYRLEESTLTYTGVVLKIKHNPKKLTKIINRMKRNNSLDVISKTSMYCVSEISYRANQLCHADPHDTTLYPKGQ